MTWTCPACKQAFAARNQSHSCDRQAIESFFADDPAGLRLFRAVHKVLEGFGEAVPAATKTQVSFRRRIRFAWLWRIRTQAMLTFDLHRHVASPRIQQVVQTRGEVWTHHVPLTKASDLDAELKGWLREAWEAAE